MLEGGEYSVNKTMPTDFQENLFKYISGHLAAEQRSPSFGEILEGLGLSPRSKSLITRSLRALEKEGRLLLKKDGRRLSISLSRKALPLLGRISAGLPIEAIAAAETLDLNDLFRREGHFALKVNGDSMIEENILDGDIIICKQAVAAREGEIVVAIIDQNHTTLKRISYQMKNMITLLPANQHLKPRAYEPERIFIQGIYVGLLRLNT